jgi:hypothetical protein
MNKKWLWLGAGVLGIAFIANTGSSNTPSVPPVTVAETTTTSTTSTTTTVPNELSALEVELLALQLIRDDIKEELCPLLIGNNNDALIDTFIGYFESGYGEELSAEGRDLFRQYLNEC